MYVGHAGVGGLHTAPGGRRGARGRPDARDRRGPDFYRESRAKTHRPHLMSTERGGGPRGQSDGPIFGPGRGSPGDSGPSRPAPAAPDPMPRVWAGRDRGGAPGGPGGRRNGIPMSHQREGELRPHYIRRALSRWPSALAPSLSLSAAAARAPRGGGPCVRAGPPRPGRRKR